MNPNSKIVHSCLTLSKESPAAKTISNPSETVHLSDHWKGKVYGIVYSAQNQPNKISKIFHDYSFLFNNLSYCLLK